MAALFPPITFAIVEVQLLANPDGSEGDKPDERLASVDLDLEVAHSRRGVVNEAAPARPGSAFGRRHSVRNKFGKLQIGKVDPTRPLQVSRCPHLLGSSAST